MESRLPHAAPRSGSLGREGEALALRQMASKSGVLNSNPSSHGAPGELISSPPIDCGENCLIPGRLHMGYFTLSQDLKNFWLSLKRLSHFFLIPLNACQVSFAMQGEKWRSCIRGKWGVWICLVEQRKRKKWANGAPVPFSFLNIPPLTFSQCLRKQFGFP